MNWMGRLVQQHIQKTDTVLDVGCGIMPATTESLRGNSLKRKIKDVLRIKMNSSGKGNLKCKSLVGCDIWRPYLEVSKKFFPVVHLSADELNKFLDDSFDVVICLDMLEHLEYDKALNVISELKRIARNKVIVYTPVDIEQPQTQIENSWGMGHNQHQQHLSLIPPNVLESLGFNVTFPEPDRNSFGIFIKKNKEDKK